MSQLDFNFYKPFLWVLGLLLVFTFLIGMLANMVSPPTDRSSDQLVLNSIKKQISPVGQSRVEPAVEVAAPVAAVEETVAAVEAEVEENTENTVAETTDTNGEAAETVAVAETEAAIDATETVAVGETEAVVDATAAALSAEIPLKVRAVVATNCAGCHQEGVKGAQRTDDSEAWSSLAAKGLDALTASVISGKGAMMPRAETSLSDDELSLAVQHMIAQSLGDEGDAAAPAAAEQQAEAAVEAEPVAEPVAEVEQPTAVVAAGAVPANVKTVVDTVCASCHISGVANAPKFGDKAAWDERMAVGLDKLVASSIVGKGVMPARGGSQLSDSELRLAIEYMVAK